MYQAIVTRIRTRPAPGFDKLLLGACGAYQVLVGIDTEDGALGVFFEVDGQLSEEFCTQNDLVGTWVGGQHVSGGMFHANRKVTSLKIRGVKSEGFWIPVKHLAYTGYDVSKLVEGFEFQELNGHPICTKYISPRTQRALDNAARTRKQGEARLRLQKLKMRYPEHQDTVQFKRAVHTITPGAHIYLSRKLHGTSGRYAHVLVENLVPRHKFLRWIDSKLKRPAKYTTAWEHINGSRRVVLTKSDNGGYYGTNTFRQSATQHLVLHKGEMLFFELVGYTDAERLIMGSVATEKLRDKNIKKQYGDVMEYTYGCAPGQCELYIYHIAYMTEDGVQINLSWPEVKRRARELDLKTVPDVEGFVYDGDHEALYKKVMTLVDGEDGVSCFPSVLDPRHIEEGIAVRVEDPEQGLRFMKAKNFVFGVLEGYLKEDDAYEDLEESS